MLMGTLSVSQRATISLGEPMLAMGVEVTLSTSIFAGSLMVAVPIEAPGRMRRQPGIVVGFFDQVFGATTLAVEPDHEVDRVTPVGHEDPVFVLAAFEQLVLHGFFRIQFRARFLVAQGHEPVWLAPPVRLVTKFALRVGIRLGPGLPLGLA